MVDYDRIQTFLDEVELVNLEFVHADSFLIFVESDILHESEDGRLADYYLSDLGVALLQKSELELVGVADDVLYDLLQRLEDLDHLLADIGVSDQQGIFQFAHCLHHAPLG